MRASRVFAAIDSHTEGMPTRVITGGVGVVPGATMAERRLTLEREMDGLRTLLMYEPRGHVAMSGAILQPPAREDADWGVLFIEVSGCLPMCGHGTMGVATVLVEAGMVEVHEPLTVIRLDTPAGLVTAEVSVRDGRAASVRLRNVASFLLGSDCTVDAGPELGGVTFDMAYGGNFYAILEAEALGVRLEHENAGELIRRGMQLMGAINEQARPQHPEIAEINVCHHVLLTAPGRDGSSARNTVVINPGWVDRSPCGTGTSARMAQLHAHRELAIGESFVHESIIGTRFVGELVEETSVGGRPAVVPTVSGRAWITGTANYLLDPDDPFPAGFLLPSW
ncbi:MAG: proline racemase family protein [Candidatus Limnocylindria bacterium]